MDNNIILDKGNVFIKKKFILKIDNDIEHSSLEHYKSWIFKYRNYIDIVFDNIKEYDFQIKVGELKYFKELKNSFKKWVKNNLHVEENKIYWLKENNVKPYYDNEKKRPYFIKKETTISNKKILLLPLSTKSRPNHDSYLFEGKKCYLNTEESYPIEKYSFLKALIDKKPLIMK